MKILLLGATGRTGKLVLRNLLASGFHVNVLVRDKHKVEAQHDHLTIFQGSTLDSQDLKQALQGCSVVISVLNISRNSDFPWDKLRTPEDFLSSTMANLLSVADRATLQKIIICSAWGASGTKNDIPSWFRWVIDHSNVGPAYRDHERQEQLLKATGWLFVIVRPVGLTNSKRPKPVRVTIDNQPKPSLTISRTDTTAFITTQVGEDKYLNQAVTISSD
jgi:uncharacterized protein YbjT (DUF2867 family)